MVFATLLLGSIWCVDLEIGVGVVQLGSSWNCLRGELWMTASWRHDPGPPLDGLCLVLSSSVPPGAVWLGHIVLVLGLS